MINGSILFLMVIINLLLHPFSINYPRKKESEMTWLDKKAILIHDIITQQNNYHTFCDTTSNKKLFRRYQRNSNVRYHDKTWMAHVVLVWKFSVVNTHHRFPHPAQVIILMMTATIKLKNTLAAYSLAFLY